jgi:peptide/nickel transport system ATP-binding protein
MNPDKILLSGRQVTKEFGFGTARTIAVNNVDFEFHEGEIISIVGESGSGKTTLAKMLLGLMRETKGEILYNGRRRNLRTYEQRKAYWKDIQAIFQDPFASFNMFHNVEKLLEDCHKLQGKRLSKEEAQEEMRDSCRFVNLKYEELWNKYPFELSGGQMQRIMIARIFMLKPKILIADEPTSMIDACSRSTILDFMLNLRDQKNMTIIFITHDVGLAYYISDSVYIMQKGSIVEKGDSERVIVHPENAYTRQLIDDVPKIHSSWDLS